jgi:5S rRNA maturation endonuclease (ribonuclease M5)
MEITDILSRLNGVKGGDGQWSARCPCRNDDNNPSLSVAEENGRILMHCHRGSGCDVFKICESIGISVAEIMPDDPQPQKTKSGLTLVAAYDYIDKDGQLLFQKLRYLDENGKKTFRQRRPKDGGGWEYELAGTPRILYNLPAVLLAKENKQPILVVEGEKDVDTLTQLGITATTMPGGAGKWLDIHTEALSGATVDVIADNDEVGRDHAAKVTQALLDAGCDVASFVCPSAKDITDHLRAGGTVTELVPLESSPVIPERDSRDDAIDAISDLLSSDAKSAEKLVRIRMIANGSAADMPLDQGRLVFWPEFIREKDDNNFDWVIPGLLERSERVILVAAEGVGKTMLARQVSILSSCGLHPFSFQPIKPVRTLFVDLENPERIIKRISRKIFNEALKLSPLTDEPQAHLFMKPAGLNLLNAGDRALLEKRLEETKPELLCIGPLYKSFVDPGGRTSEAVAIEIAKYFDDIRTAYKCALWIEHHAPLGSTMATRDLRPFGSAVWSRWPEFGIALHPAIGAPFTYDVKHFRGARDERPWPSVIARGRQFPFETISFLEVSSQP